MAQRTALVTGASRGIGEAFAQLLAARGDDLVVVARDRARLDSLAGDLRSQFDVNVEVVAADLTREEGLASVVPHAATVDTLINNAAYGTNGNFDDLDVDRELGQIDLNVKALVALTHAALRAMTQRGRGGILNVSSLAALQPSATFAVYGATKAFVTSFTQAVHEEVRGRGVNVCVVMPGFTRTDFQRAAGLDDTSQIPGWAWQSAEDVATAGLTGLDAGKATVVPGLVNRTLAAVVGFTPDIVTRRVASVVVRRT